MFFDNRDNLFKLNSYQKKYLSEIRKIKPSEPFLPWKNRIVINLEGVFACGWTNNNLVIMISHDGYILADPSSGEVIEKEYEFSPYKLMSNDNLEFKLNKVDNRVKIFGLYGGNGNLVHSEGWELSVIYPSWPNSAVMIKKPSTPGN